MFSGLFVLITHSPPHERHISHGYPAPTWIGLPTPFWVIPQDEQNITFLSSSRVSNTLPFPVSLVGNSTSTFCPSKNAECFVYFFKRSASYSGTFKVSSCNSRKKTKSVQFSSSALDPQHFCSPRHMMGCYINQGCLYFTFAPESADTSRLHPPESGYNHPTSVPHPRIASFLSVLLITWRNLWVW